MFIWSSFDCVKVNVDSILLLYNLLNLGILFYSWCRDGKIDFGYRDCCLFCSEKGVFYFVFIGFVVWGVECRMDLVIVFLIGRYCLIKYGSFYLN